MKTLHHLKEQSDSFTINDFSETIKLLAQVDISSQGEKALKKSLKEDLSFINAFLEGVFTVPGDGCIDYKPFFDVLKKFKYSGWLVVEAEQDPKKANPFEYAKKGFEYLSKTLKDCEFSVST